MKFNFKRKFHDIIGELVYDKSWTWLSFVISLLSTIEVEMKIAKDKEFIHELNTADTRRISPPPEELETYAQRVIPKNTLYCQGCPFYTYSKVARFFYGEQCDGYCYYLGKGDFSFIRPTELLWDGCKECGINDEIEYYESIEDRDNDNL
jgi:hypothetical protein